MVTDVLSLVHLRLPSLREERSVEAFSITITRRLVRRMLRGVARPFEPTSLEDHATLDVSSRNLEREELLEFLQACLDEGESILFDAMYVGGSSVEEVKRILGISLSQLYVRRWRLRQKLARRWRQYEAGGELSRGIARRLDP